MNDGRIIRLDLSGVDQLTDMFFCAVRDQYQNTLFCRGLETICLQGCHHITDYGISVMAKLFFNLISVIYLNLLIQI